MEDHTNKRFKNSTITIAGNTMKWDDYMIQITNISQVWIGNSFKNQLPVPLILILLFIALSGISTVNIIILLLALAIYLLVWSYFYWKRKDTRDINFEISSGKVYSFASNNEDFSIQAYELITDLIMKNNMYSNLRISFSGDGKIYENSIMAMEMEMNDDTQALNFQFGGTNDPVLQDLEKLFTCYTKKIDKNKEVMDLVENIIKFSHMGDDKELKEAYSKFITLGLIGDCNELGLYTLIESIKTCVY